MATEEVVGMPRRGYALPYYTMGATETELLISNPNPIPVQVRVTVFGRATPESDPNCPWREPQEGPYVINPNCTVSVTIQQFVVDNAGLVIVSVSPELPVVVHLLYWLQDTLLGGELAGQDNFFAWSGGSNPRRYACGYRSMSLPSAPPGSGLSGVVFVSNPNPVTLSGSITFYLTRAGCVPSNLFQLSIAPGCTQGIAFPPMDFGFGIIELEHQAVINVLLFPPGSPIPVAAELIGEANRLP